MKSYCSLFFLSSFLPSSWALLDRQNSGSIPRVHFACLIFLFLREGKALAGVILARQSGINGTPGAKGVLKDKPGNRGDGSMSF